MSAPAPRARRRAPRECARCGRVYLRRNLIEVWATHAPGSRAGWIKQIIRVCLHCQPQAASRRVLMIATARLGKEKDAR